MRRNNAFDRVCVCMCVILRVCLSVLFGRKLLNAFT